MRRITRKGLIKKLDKVFGELIRARGVCAKCRKGAEKVTLHCAHIFSRKNMSVRWDLNNALCLCYHDHFWWAHKEPIEFTEFVKEYLGEYNYNTLKNNANTIKKWTTEELKELLSALQTLGEK